MEFTMKELIATINQYRETEKQTTRDVFDSRTVADGVKLRFHVVEKRDCLIKRPRQIRFELHQ